MLNNQQRREILNAAKATGHQGSVLDLFAQAEAGVDVPTLLYAEQDAKRQMEAQQMQIARTQQEQQVGLREEHARGNTGASMAFPDVAPNASFNTEGMKVPINISKFDQQGHLVQSFKNVPPGVQNLPTGPGRGTVIETPAYKYGGYKQKYQGGGPSAEVDILDLDKNANPFTYHKPTKNQAILESNKAGLGTEGLDVTYINPDNIQSLSSNVTPEEWEMIQDAQGAYPLPEVEITGDFEPQDIPKGYDPYANNSMEQKIFDNLGMDGVLRYRQQRAGQHAATEPVGAWGSAILGGGAVLGGVGALPGLAGVTTPSALASGATRLVTAGPRYFGNKFLTHAGRAITGVEGGFGSYLGALRSGQMTTQGLRTLTPFQQANSALMTTYYGKTLAGLPGAVNKMYEGAGAELTGAGDMGSRLRFVEGFADVLPYSKGAGFLRNKFLGGITPLEVTKFGEAFDRGDYTEMGARGLAFGLKGDQSGLIDEGQNLLSTAISTGRKFGLFDTPVDLATGFASDTYTGAADYIADLFDTYQNFGTGDQGYQDFLTGQETDRVYPSDQRMGGPRMYQNGGPADVDPVEDYVRKYLNDKFNIDYDKLLDNQKQELRRRAIQDARYLEQTKTRPDLYPELNFNKS